jgi:hypothetical protein
MNRFYRFSFLGPSLLAEVAIIGDPSVLAYKSRQHLMQRSGYLACTSCQTIIITGSNPSCTDKYSTVYGILNSLHCDSFFISNKITTTKYGSLTLFTYTLSISQNITLAVNFPDIVSY